MLLVTNNKLHQAVMRKANPEVDLTTAVSLLNSYSEAFRQLVKATAQPWYM